jgi:hypothetical protein
MKPFNLSPEDDAPGGALSAWSAQGKDPRATFSEDGYPRSTAVKPLYLLHCNRCHSAFDAKTLEGVGGLTAPVCPRCRYIERESLRTRSIEGVFLDAPRLRVIEGVRGR